METEGGAKAELGKTEEPGGGGIAENAETEAAEDEATEEGKENAINENCVGGCETEEETD